jgi:hypothetical protein
LANLFPLLVPETNDEEVPDESRKQFFDICNSIAAIGQLEPITIYDKKILDGRNRYLACLAVGVKPITQYWQDDWGVTPLQFVIAKNLNRRDLTASQRACVAVGDEISKEIRRQAMERMLAGKKDPPKKFTEGGKSDSRDQLGEMFGVSGPLIDAAQYLKDNDPDAYKRCLRGEDKSVIRAAKQIKAVIDPDPVQAELIPSPVPVRLKIPVEVHQRIVEQGYDPQQLILELLSKYMEEV